MKSDTAPLPAPRPATASPSAAATVPALALSVVMPTSGRVALVAETLNSLAAQTQRNWELIVPDDSPDEAARAEIKKLVDAFARETGIAVTYLFTAPRLLQSRNTNQGLAQARGRWVRILHSDDLVAPWGFEAELTIAERFKDAAEALFIDPVAFREKFTPCEDFKTSLLSPRYLVRAMLHSGTALPSCTLFSHALLQRIGAFDPGYDFLCDWKFFYRLLIDQIRQGKAVTRVTPAWIGWRVHGDSVTGRMWATHYREHLRLMDEIRDSDDLTELVAFTGVEQEDFFRRGLLYRHRRLFEDARLQPDFMEPARLGFIEELLAADPRMRVAQEELLNSLPSENGSEAFKAEWRELVGRAIVRQDNAREAAALVEAGNRAAAARDMAEAASCYGRGVALDPRSAPAWGGLGYTLIEEGRHAEAVEALRQSLQLQPVSADVNFNLGNALASLERHAEALEAYQAASSAAPARTDVLLALAHALIRGGRNSEAVAACEQILAQDPAHAEALRLRDEFAPFAGHYEQWRETRFRFIVERFGADAFRGRSLLELGAGHGILGSQFQSLGARVTCAEARADHVAAGAARFPTQRFVCQNLEEDFRHLGVYDIVLHTGLLYHLHKVESHLSQLREVTGEWLILETEVSDSDDPEFILEIKEQKEAYDQSFVGVGTRPSAAYIERVLRSVGFEVERCDDARINAGFHRYDWPVTNADTWKFGRWEHGLRRFWFCRKLPQPAARS